MFVARLPLQNFFARLFEIIFGQTQTNERNDEMPQEMNVLRCYSCSMYQVHIVKKSNKWQCKICNEKQSIQAVYFKGSGSDCRNQVQHLNGLKATEEDQRSLGSVSIEEFGLDCVADDDDVIEPCDCPSKSQRTPGKWAKYLDSDDDEQSFCESVEDDKNIFSSRENSQTCRKPAKRPRQSYSLPPTQNFGKAQNESGEEFDDPEAIGSRSQTYPLIDKSGKIAGKWDEYLESKFDHGRNKLRSDRNEFTVVDSDSTSSTLGHNIFEDPDDDLDITIDF